MMPGFTDDDIEDVLIDVGNEDGEDGVDGLLDSAFACAFCDNGGELLCCSGTCLSSFHPTVDVDNTCKTPGHTKEDVDEIQEYFCKNCEHQQHQCYVCGKLGSSVKDKHAEVFICTLPTCGHFYHPHCVSKLRHWDDEVALEDLQTSIAQGGSFAVCRRCPRAYKCLPKHGIIDELGIPSTVHIKCPLAEEEKAAGKLKKKQKAEVGLRREKMGLAKGSSISKDSSHSKSAERTSMKLPPIVKQVETMKVKRRSSVASNSSKKLKAADVSRIPVKKAMKYGSVGVDGSSIVDAKIPLQGKQLFNHMTKKTEPTRSANGTPTRKQLGNSLSALGANDENRLLEMQDAAASVNFDVQKYTLPSTPCQSVKGYVGKIKLGRVEGSVEAVQTALKKLEEEKCTIEDAKVIMGLNFASGVEVNSNLFVDKVLEFSPKLVLIIPTETESRLDKKKRAYDLVWEDDQSLSGTSLFYQPGSIDENDEQMDQWNLVLPPVSLWSHPDWTRQKAIAEKNGHVSEGCEEANLVIKSSEMGFIAEETEDNFVHCGDTSMLNNLPLQHNESEKRGPISTKGQNERYLGRKSIKDSEDSDGSKNLPSKDERMRRCDNRSHDSEMSSKASGAKLSDSWDSRWEIVNLPTTQVLQSAKDATKRKHSNDGYINEASVGDKQSDGGCSERDHYGVIPYNSPTNVTDVRSLGEGHPSRSFEMPSHGGLIDEGNLNFVSNMEFSTASNEFHSLIPGDMGWVSGTRRKSPVEEQKGARHRATDVYFGDVRRSPDNLFDRSSADVHSSGYQYHEPSISGLHRTAFVGTQLSAADEMEWRFSQNNTEPYSSYRYSGVNVAEQYMGRGRGNVDNQDYSYTSDVDRDLDIRSQLAVYGQDPAAAIPCNSPTNVTDVRFLGEGHPSRSFEMPSHGGLIDKGNLNFVSNMEFNTASNEFHSLIPGDMGWVSGTRRKSPVEEQKGVRHQATDVYFGDVRRSPDNLFDRSSADVHSSGYQYHEPSISGLHRTAFVGTQLSAADEMEWRFSQNNTEPYSSYRYSGVNVAEQYMGRGRGNVDNQDYSYTSDIDRDLDIRSQLAVYGQDPAAASDPILSRSGSLPSSASNMHVGPLAPASYRNMSVMQQYTPQQHELNFPMTRNFRFQPQMHELSLPVSNNNYMFELPPPQLSDLNYLNHLIRLAASYPVDQFAASSSGTPYPFLHPGFSRVDQ